MSVYDCEPPQLDCDIPPPDEENSKRRENDYLDDLELTSYSIKNLNSNNEQSITSALNLYSSSPPPVDDFFTPSSDHLEDELDIPNDETSEATEKSVNEEELNHIDIPELDEIVMPEKVDDTRLENENCDDTSSIGRVNDEFQEDGPKSINVNESDTHFVFEDEEPIEIVQLNSIQPSQVNPIAETTSKVPEPDEDDDFNDFEQAIPIDRHIEHQQHVITEETKNDAHFETDFGAFEANFDNEFTSFSTESQENIISDVKLEPTSHEVDSDDDFGDFNDFTQAPASIVTTAETPKEPNVAVKVMNDSEVKSILTEMFPSNQETNEETELTTCIETDVKIVKDIDSTLALSYDYKDSTTNQTLIKALGIDERNILFGAQWSSNMPRFASDLSFNPLEPSKFASASFNKNSNSVVNNSPSSMTSCKAKEKHENESEKEQLPQPDIVPQFDWNVAGLINPLDGKQTGALKANEEPSLTYDLSVFDTSPQQQSQQKGTEVLNSDLDNAKHLWPTERFDVIPVVRERTIKLPETHIFTPVKSISPVALEVSRESSPIENEKEKRSTVIKEYHDIEYSLEPQRKTESEGDFGEFNDFQSASITATNLVNSGVLMPTINPLEPAILEPLKVNDAKTLAVNNDFEKFATPSTSAPIVKKNSNSKYDVFAELVKPSNDSIEDDFADFQAAPTIVPQKQPSFEKHTYKEDSSITLSPSRLVNNMQKLPEKPILTTTWMNDTLDSDEISRIEAAFPKCKVDTIRKKQPDVISPPISKEAEDEWCDFQSVSQSSINVMPTKSSNNTVPINQTSSFTIRSSSFDTKKQNSDNLADTSDWSDFVSVPIVKPSINTSQFLSKPNFSSWNQSTGKPYVNHTTSFLSSNNNYPNSHFNESFYPNMPDNRRNPPMTITNNFNYNFERNNGRGTTTAPPYQMSNGISTILPDLEFALPKTLVNLSRGGATDTTKK